jgi:hypothetical protein
MTIGGKLKRSLIEEFLAACEAEGMGRDYMEDLEEADVLGAVAKGEALTVCGNEINYGNPEEVEAFCREHGLPYSKEWDAGGEYGAGGEYWSPETFLEYGIGEIGDTPAVDIKTIRGLGSWEAVLAYLDQLSGKLPPLEIEEG